MAVRPVLRLPNAVLKTPARAVREIGPAERALADDLVDTMRASPACVGLAATQIGVDRRAICVDVTGHRKARSCHGLIVMFDPVLLVARDPVGGREGCMSVPDLTGEVRRATGVVVSGTGPDGHMRVVDADAFEARALLHEIDHLDGVLFLDRVESAGHVFSRVRYR